MPSQRAECFSGENSTTCFDMQCSIAGKETQVNAVINTSREDVVGSTGYMTLFPCNICAGIMISAGVKKIVYFDDKYHDMDFSKAARKLLRAASVPFTQYDGVIDKLWVERRAKQ